MLHVALVLSASLAMPLGAFAQTPGRTITIVVPFTPGTGPDILARTIGEEIQRRWNQPVVVDNKPGASGNIGTQVVARAAPDGHTLLMTSNPFTANISLLKDVAYDPIKSFAPDRRARLRRAGAGRASIAPGGVDQGIHRLRQGAAE